MDRYAIFNDAGYFFAAGANAAFGAQTPRKHVSIKSPQNLFDELCVIASEISGGIHLLRAYWYDAMPGPRLSLEQSTISLLSGTKLRLGALNSAGEQKGVDSLIVTDLIDLARNRAITDAVVIAGDEDLRIGVQIAQSFGVRVHLLAAGDPGKNVSPALQAEADSVTALDANWFLKHLNNSAATKTIPNGNGEKKTITATSTADDPQLVDIKTASRLVIDGILDALDEEEVKLLAHHFSTQNSVPPEYDGKLIARVGAKLKKRLSGTEMRDIRGMFVRAIRIKLG